jgi:hypothetical protein
MLTHIVGPLLPDQATVESYWCAPSRSFNLEGCWWTGLKVVGRGVGGGGGAHDFTHSWAK